MLIPMQYYGTEGITATMDNQISGYEVSKMFSVDKREYCNFTSDLYLTYGSENQTNYRGL